MRSPDLSSGGSVGLFYGGVHAAVSCFRYVCGCPFCSVLCAVYTSSSAEFASTASIGECDPPLVLVLLIIRLLVLVFALLLLVLVLVQLPILVLTTSEVSKPGKR